MVCVVGAHVCVVSGCVVYVVGVLCWGGVEVGVGVSVCVGGEWGGAMCTPARREQDHQRM